MERVNMSRVILGGLVAGVVYNILASLVDGIALATQWGGAMKALGRAEFGGGQIVGFILIGFATGIFTVWLYAAIRPRYGAGPKTAIYAGLMVWAIGILLPNVAFMGVQGLFPSSLTIATTTAAIVESVLAALAGAALYREETAPAARSMAARA
jgi:hypothetical protein